jgi:hypothetical protein
MRQPGSALPHNHLVPKQRNPLLRREPVFLRTSAQLTFAIQISDKLGLSKGSYDFAFVFEPGEKGSVFHGLVSLSFLHGCLVPPPDGLEDSHAGLYGQRMVAGGG